MIVQEWLLCQKTLLVSGKVAAPMNLMSKRELPPRTRLPPVRAIWSKSAPGLLVLLAASSQMLVPLALRLRPLVTVRMPALAPGLTLPPLVTVTNPTEPEPPSVPPALTMILAEASEPFTRSVPALIVVAPVYVLAPVRVSVPAPSLVSEPLLMTPDILAKPVLLLVNVMLKVARSTLPDSSRSLAPRRVR